ncbi:MAG: hypothetical protein EA411_00110 [Saprospirales bacterium]|nr:MAG: hypothetical protein EA411_00110 [Saprospirales bacterium]
MNFRFYKQLDSMDCWPIARRMVVRHYGKSYSLPFLRERCYIYRVSLKGINEASKAIEFRTAAVEVPLYPFVSQESRLNIITEDRSILERIFDQILNLIKNKPL